MKKIQTLAFALVVALAPILNPIAHAADWTVLGTTGFSSGGASHNISLATDSSDTPYIAYRDINDNKVTVMKYNGSSWAAVGSAGFSSGGTGTPFLAIDSSDTLYVVYSDLANSERATVMKFNGTSWELVGSAGFSTGAVYYTSLVFDSSDIPYVVFRDGANGFKATVMKYETGSWGLVGSAGFSAGAAQYLAIAFNSSDVPYVAYRDDANSSGTSVMKYETGSWGLVGSANFSSSEVTDISLAFDSSDVPYVAYCDTIALNRGVVRKYEAGSWDTVGGAGFSLPAYSPSLAINSSDEIYVAFKDTSDGVTVEKLNGGIWEVFGSHAFSEGSVQYISLAIDSSDNLYVGYQDEANSYKTTVMKYAEAASSNPSEDVTISATVNEALTLGVSGNAISFDVTPTANDGQDLSQTLSFTVQSNVYEGYMLESALTSSNGDANELYGATYNEHYTSAEDGNGENYFKYRVDTQDEAGGDADDAMSSVTGTPQSLQTDWIDFGNATNATNMLIDSEATGNSTTNGDTIVVDYDFNVDYTTIPDSYEGTIVYTLSSSA